MLTLSLRRLEAALGVSSVPAGHPLWCATRAVRPHPRYALSTTAWLPPCGGTLQPEQRLAATTSARRQAADVTSPRGWGGVGGEKRAASQTRRAGQNAAGDEGRCGCGRGSSGAARRPSCRRQEAELHIRRRDPSQHCFRALFNCSSVVEKECVHIVFAFAFAFDCFPLPSASQPTRRNCQSAN